MWPFQHREKLSTTVAKFKISGMHCVSCSLGIDDELEATAGVVSAQTSYSQSRSTVNYHADQVSISKLQQVVSSLGYQAELEE